MALSDMTRPRMAWSARNCSVALLVATNAMLAAPIGTSRAIAQASLGESGDRQDGPAEDHPDAGQQARRRTAAERGGQATEDGARAHRHQEPAVEPCAAVEGELGQAAAA